MAGLSVSGNDRIWNLYSEDLAKDVFTVVTWHREHGGWNLLKPGYHHHHQVRRCA